MTTYTKPISKRATEILVSAAYPDWSPAEVDAAISRADFRMDIGRGRTLAFTLTTYTVTYQGHP
jgi:hypothetical protein